MASAKLRCFIALSPDKTVREALASLQSRVRGIEGIDARFPAPGGLHLTLVFLGDLPYGLLDPVKTAMNHAVSRAAAPAKPAGFAFSGLGTFPRSGHRARILWAGLQDPSQTLTRISAHLKQGVAAAGVKPDRQAFFPHITLARFKQPPSPRILSLIREAASEFSGWPPFPAGEIHLFTSRLTPRGARYTRVHTSRW